MDVLFQILLPEVKLVEGLTPHQIIFSWGGADYPQEPTTYKWGSHVELVPSAIQPHIPRFIPKGYISGDDWVFLDVTGDGLDLMEAEVNGIDVDWGGYKLDELLKLLLEQYDKWVLIFELHYDQIDHVYNLTVEECINELKANLRRDIKREGFIALPKK